ncbi:type II toxin-antitoxin system RelE/ParE family toxin [Desulfosporosinus sp.]|nr:type II toxin-antitoxin system RelE/ParE family toxin [Desulfosporosinus sp.]MCO5385660.1 type II toxin-antitoxin system RelE/ParE family toxin [Desulfosporosinus sp.]MDA8222482.1 type II toxin-antitoxin system RelE/ParE family toxin [Desulfitobacterium hafniense]
MGKVEYSPKALEDLQRIKAYIIENFGVDVFGIHTSFEENVDN